MTASEDSVQVLQGETLTIVDVGARGGFHNRWKRIAGVPFFVGIEADEKECESLSASAGPSEKYIFAALDSKTRERTLYICRHEGCTSLYEPNRQFTDRFSFGWAFELVETRAVKTTTLQAVCAKHDIQPDVLKIDTQGCELDILQGLGDDINGVLCLELEVEFSHIYKGQPLFSEIETYLRGKGFVLLGLRRSLWRHAGCTRASQGGHLVHGDALFYNAEKLGIGGVYLRKMIVIMACYQQFDFAESLCRQAGIDPAGVSALLPRDPFWVRPWGRLVSGRVHRGFRRFVDRLRSEARDWHDPDYF